MSSEQPNTPALGLHDRSPWGIATVALVAGAAQVVASIALGLAPLDRFSEAAGESPTIYMVVAALLGLGVLAIWLVRERIAIALTLTVLWPVAMGLALYRYTSALGLAYHGEFVLHHFSAVLCLALAITLPIGWARDPRLGKLRWLPALLAVPGAIALGLAHLGQLPTWLDTTWAASRALPMIGASLLLLAWPVAAGLFWSKAEPRERRWLPWVVLLPLVVRVGTTGPDALTGTLTPDDHASWVGAAIVLTSIATLIVLRPRLERWVLAVIGTICLIGCLIIHLLYKQGFGEFEDGLGGLLESLFGFAVPYPSYVGEMRSAALVMGLLFAFVTVYAALVSTEDRVRGVSLGLLLVAGIGFSSPHLVLMFGTGALLLVETLLPGAPDRELERFDVQSYDVRSDDTSGELVGVREVFEALAERLGFAAPAIVTTGPGAAMLSVRGELRGTPVDLHAKVEPKHTQIDIVIGLPGREQPVFELQPDSGQRGQRPAHLLARSHRLRGELRALEAFGDAPLDALTSFPTAHLRAWDGGVEIELGRELTGLRVDHLEALVRNVVRALEPA